MLNEYGTFLVKIVDSFWKIKSVSFIEKQNSFITLEQKLLITNFIRLFFYIPVCTCVAVNSSVFYVLDYNFKIRIFPSRKTKIQYI